MESESARAVSSTFVAAGLFALVGWLAGFGSLVVRARLHLGHWPVGRSGNPFDGSYRAESIDPDRYGLHYDLTSLFLIAAAWVLPFSTIVLLASLVSRRTRPPAALTFAYLLALALAAVTIAFDPGGFLNWFAD